MGMSAPSSVIKSMQSGLITINSGNASATATIAAVNPLKSVVINQGWSGDGTLQSPAALDVTNATTVTSSRNAAATTGISQVRYTVIEFF